VEDVVTDRRWAKGYEDLDVFQRAMRALKPIHELVLTFPDYEKYDLANQIRRATKSIPANIAEGYGRRRSAREFVRHLTIAMGSANEVEIHLRIAHELSYMTEEEHQRFAAEYQVIGKQLRRLIEHWSSLATPATSDQRPGDQS
jgi:four helix bundle protein